MKKPPKRGRAGKPLTDTQRLKRHYGANAKNHKISDLPKRGAGRRKWVLAVQRYRPEM